MQLACFMVALGEYVVAAVDVSATLSRDSSSAYYFQLLVFLSELIFCFTAPFMSEDNLIVVLIVVLVFVLDQEWPHEGKGVPHPYHVWSTRVQCFKHPATRELG